MFLSRGVLVVVLVLVLSDLAAAPEVGGKVSAASSFQEGMEKFLGRLHDQIAYEEMKAAMVDYARLSSMPLSKEERHSLEIAHNAAMAFVFESVLAASLPPAKCGPDSFGSWLGSVLTSPTDLILLSVIGGLVGYLVYNKVIPFRGLLVVNQREEEGLPEVVVNPEEAVIQEAARLVAAAEVGEQ